MLQCSYNSALAVAVKSFGHVASQCQLKEHFATLNRLTTYLWGRANSPEIKSSLRPFCTLSCFDHSRSVCIDVTPKALRDCIFRTSYLWLYLTADRRYCDTLMPSTVWLCVCYSRVFRVNRTHNYSGPRRPFHVPFIILSDVHRHRSR